MEKKRFTMHIDVDKLLPATEEEKAYVVKMRPSSTFFKDGVKRLLKNKVAQDVEDKKVDFGIVICGSGNGIAMSANKHQGVQQ